MAKFTYAAADGFGNPTGTPIWEGDDIYDAVAAAVADTITGPRVLQFNTSETFTIPAFTDGDHNGEIGFRGGTNMGSIENGAHLFTVRAAPGENPTIFGEDDVTLVTVVRNSMSNFVWEGIRVKGGYMTGDVGNAPIRHTGLGDSDHRATNVTYRNLKFGRVFLGCRFTDWLEDVIVEDCDFYGPFSAADGCLRIGNGNNTNDVINLTVRRCTFRTIVPEDDPDAPGEEAFAFFQIRSVKNLIMEDIDKENGFCGNVAGSNGVMRRFKIGKWTGGVTGGLGVNFGHGMTVENCLFINSNLYIDEGVANGVTGVPETFSVSLKHNTFAWNTASVASAQASVGSNKNMCYGDIMGNIFGCNGVGSGNAFVVKTEIDGTPYVGSLEQDFTNIDYNIWTVFNTSPNSEYFGIINIPTGTNKAVGYNQNEPSPLYTPAEWRAETGFDVHSQFVANYAGVVFNDPANGDFRLAPNSTIGRAVIPEGVISLSEDKDVNGTTRSYPADMGAFPSMLSTGNNIPQGNSIKRARQNAALSTVFNSSEVSAVFGELPTSFTIFNPSIPSGFNSLTNIEAGKSYLILSKQALNKNLYFH